MQIATAVSPDYAVYLLTLLILCGLLSGLLGIFFQGFTQMSRNELKLVAAGTMRAKFLVENITNCRQIARKSFLTASIFFGLTILACIANRLVYGVPIPLL